LLVHGESFLPLFGVPHDQGTRKIPKVVREAEPAMNDNYRETLEERTARINRDGAKLKAEFRIRLERLEHEHVLKLLDLFQEFKRRSELVANNHRAKSDTLDMLHNTLNVKAHEFSPVHAGENGVASTSGQSAGTGHPNVISRNPEGNYKQAAERK